MQCDVLTLFPDIISGVVSHSILKRAQEKGYVQLRIHNIRDYTTDPHRVADDIPYGGGGGMVMKAEPIFRGRRCSSKGTRRPSAYSSIATRDSIESILGRRTQSRVPSDGVYLWPLRRNR